MDLDPTLPGFREDADELDAPPAPDLFDVLAGAQEATLELDLGGGRG